MGYKLKSSIEKMRVPRELRMLVGVGTVGSSIGTYRLDNIDSKEVVKGQKFFLLLRGNDMYQSPFLILALQVLSRTRRMDGKFN